MHSNTDKPYPDGLQVNTGLYHPPFTQVEFDPAAMAAYSSASYQYPSMLSSSAVPTSAPGSAWEYDSVSAHSEPNMASSSWMDSYGAMPTISGDSARLGTLYGWNATDNSYSAYPTDESETSSNLFSTDSAMLDASPQPTHQPLAYGMDYASQYRKNPGTLDGTGLLRTQSPYYNSSASSPTGRGPSPSPRVNKPVPQRVKSNPRLRVKRDGVGSRKRKQEPGNSSDSLYPGDLATPEKTLLSRYAHRMPELPRRLTSEDIRREAWRICKAEAREMSERRMKLLEHEGGALERETAKLQISVTAMRESVVRGQKELEMAVEMAERLSTASY